MERLKIAIQKSGRLHDDSIKLLKEAGISINNGKDQLKAPATNFPLEVYYLRNGDIPKYLQDGVVDLAIIGENLLIEKGNNIESAERLKFSNVGFVSLYPRVQNIKDFRISKIRG